MVIPIRWGSHLLLLLVVASFFICSPATSSQYYLLKDIDSDPTLYLLPGTYMFQVQTEEDHAQDALYYNLELVQDDGLRRSVVNLGDKALNKEAARKYSGSFITNLYGRSELRPANRTSFSFKPERTTVRVNGSSVRLVCQEIGNRQWLADYLEQQIDKNNTEPSTDTAELFIENPRLRMLLINFFVESEKTLEHVIGELEALEDKDKQNAFALTLLLTPLKALKIIKENGPLAAWTLEKIGKEPQNFLSEIKAAYDAELISRDEYQNLLILYDLFGSSKLDPSLSIASLNLAYARMITNMYLAKDLREALPNFFHYMQDPNASSLERECQAIIKKSTE